MGRMCKRWSWMLCASLSGLGVACGSDSPAQKSSEASVAGSAGSLGGSTAGSASSVAGSDDHEGGSSAAGSGNRAGSNQEGGASAALGGRPAGWLYTEGAKLKRSDGQGSGTVWVGRGVNIDDIFFCGYDNSLWMPDPGGELKKSDSKP